MTRRVRAGLILIAVGGSMLACRTQQVGTIMVDPGKDTDRDAAASPIAQGNCPVTAPAVAKVLGAACACNIECASGQCSGVCCADESCSVQRPLGVACTQPTDCQSGFCADGVCCNVACTGACVACNSPTLPGDCSPVPAGAPDKHGVCRRDAPASCGQSGSCNGLGGCAKYDAGFVCRSPSCQGNDQLPASLCDGEGTCIHGSAIPCVPSICEGNACRSGCDSDAQCVSPNKCVDGSCGKKGLGQSCGANTECDSAFCVDGVCCQNACVGRCSFCASPETAGRCLSVRAGGIDLRAARGERDPSRSCVDQGPAACAGNGRCDGQGGCQRYADGTVCREPDCDAAANTAAGAGTCRAGSCQFPTPRSCAPFQGCSGNQCRTSCAIGTECVGGALCQSGDCGKRPSGSLCSRNIDCNSNVCAQGRCCDTTCNGVCRSCAVPGQEGTCSNVAAGATDPSGTCRDDVCSNGCDGAGGCRREAPGTTCGGATCGGLTTRTTRTCSPGGVCETRTADCPFGSLCSNGSCNNIFNDD